MHDSSIGSGSGYAEFTTDKCNTIWEHKFAQESTMVDIDPFKLHTVRREPPWPFTGKSGRQGDSGNRDRVGPKQRTQFYW